MSAKSVSPVIARHKLSGSRGNAPAQPSPAKTGLAGLAEILRRVAEQSTRAATLAGNVTATLNILVDKLNSPGESPNQAANPRKEKATR